MCAVSVGVFAALFVVAFGLRPSTSPWFSICDVVKILEAFLDSTVACSLVVVAGITYQETFAD